MLAKDLARRKGKGVPARTDHAARRREVAEAVWRVLSERGFAGLSLRVVAAEMGATTGLLTHYFPNKRALVEHALTLLHERTDERLAGTPTDVRAALLSVLPLDEERLLLSRIWVGFWDLALVDVEYAAHEAARYERWRDKLRPLVDELTDDVEATLDHLTSFTHGLVVQALFAPDRFPPARQAALVDALVHALVGRTVDGSTQSPGTTSDTL